MGKHRALNTAVATLLLSSSVWADSGNHGIDQAVEPILIEGNNNSTIELQRQHKRITTRERQTEHRQHHQLSINYPHTTMTIGHHQMGQDHQQQMADLEQRLANIEALLEKLLAMQKP